MPALRTARMTIAPDTKTGVSNGDVDAPARRAGTIPVIAYLNSEYPSLSHTFIEREVRALRERGIEIRTFSVRAPGKHATLGEEHARAAKETQAILASRANLVFDALRAAATSPLSTFRTIIAGQRLAPPGVSSRIRHAAYALEGIWLARRLREEGIGHIHCHMANNGAAVALLACRYDPTLTYSLSIHGSAEFFHVDTWTLAPKVEGAVFVRCISNFCRAQIMAWTSPACWDRLHVVHCGIDVSRFSATPRESSRTLRLLTVGRLHPIKGYPLLLEACRTMSDEGIDWTLDMVGDGPMMGTLTSHADRLGIRSRVTFSGAVGQDRIQPHFDRAGVIVISSFMEGVPVVLMEGMAKGMAVLTTAVGGIPELVEPGVSAEVVPPGSAAALADGLRRLAAAGPRLPDMGAAGRRRVLAEFSIEQTATGMADLFSRCLSPSERHA